MKLFRNSIRFVAVASVVAMVCAAEARKDEVTLVMVPRDEASVKVGLDIANRYPTLLLSYLVGANGAVSLHGWTGSQWVNITMADFQTGDFFSKAPDSALLIESGNQAIPDSLIPPEAWASSAFNISTTETRPLIHLIGQYYDFKYKDWDWFAKRYGMSIDAINPEGLNITWYHKRLAENLAKKDDVADSDLRYWSVIRMPAAVIVVEEEAVVVVEEEMTLESLELEAPMPDDPEVDVDPFTNSVPEAVIMGAGDAEAETTTETITETVTEVIVVEETM